MKFFLLDTGLLLGLTREASWARQAFEQLNLNDREAAAFTSVICHGEILALAEKNGWGEKKRVRLDSILRGLPKLDINREKVLNAYARIYAWTHGNPVDDPCGAPPPKPAVSMSQNDLWIAATAHAYSAVLLSTDKGFVHLNGVWLDFIYIQPA